MPNIIKMLYMWKTFKNPFLDLKMAICDESINSESCCLEVTATSYEAFFFHCITVSHLIALYVKRILSYDLDFKET